MSGSRIRVGIDYHMLDKHHETCNKEWQDSTGGHTILKTCISTRVRGPTANWYEALLELSPAERIESIKRMEQLVVDELLTEFEFNKHEFIHALVRSVMTQAIDHVTTVHKVNK